MMLNSAQELPTQHFEMISEKLLALENSLLERYQ